MSHLRATPHQREFLTGSLGPLGVYRRWSRESPVGFLFESVSGGEHVSRFSFLGAEPREIYRLFPDRLEVERGGVSESLPGEPLAALRKATTRISAQTGEVPFTGGFVGWFGGPPGSGHGLVSAGHSPTSFNPNSGVTVWVPSTRGHT